MDRVKTTIRMAMDAANQAAARKNRFLRKSPRKGGWAEEGRRR
jgi:hypothetical protein